LIDIHDRMIQIRKCHAGDFHEVVALMRQLWPQKPFDAERLRPAFDKALVSESQTYLCATDGDRVVGFGSVTWKNCLWHEGHLVFIDELVVNNLYRNKGIGSRLLGELVALARIKGCCRIELDCAFWREETGAFAFYEKHKFTRRAFVFSRVL